MMEIEERGSFPVFIQITPFMEKIASQPTVLPADLIEAEHLQIWFIYGPACFSFYSNFADIRTNRKIVNFDLIHFSVCFVMQLCNNSELWHCQQGWGVWLLTIQIRVSSLIFCSTAKIYKHEAMCRNFLLFCAIITLSRLQWHKLCNGSSSIMYVSSTATMLMLCNTIS